MVEDETLEAAAQALEWVDYANIPEGVGRHITPVVEWAQQSATLIQSLARGAMMRKTTCTDAEGGRASGEKPAGTKALAAPRTPDTKVAMRKKVRTPVANPVGVVIPLRLSGALPLLAIVISLHAGVPARVVPNSRGSG